VTSDAKHVELGLTDKSDSARSIMRWLWRRGIAPEQVLIAGDELGPLGGLPGSDSWLMVGEAERATAVSVGAEPGGVRAGVVWVGGGPDTFAAMLEDQIAPPPARAPDRRRGPGMDACDRGRRSAARTRARVAADARRRAWGRAAA
jgi:hypothetical protein